ncbi:MAG: hypothetical protein V3V96_15400 [Acidiferrobacterales bacterium]
MSSRGSTRKESLRPVAWDQSSILRRITKLEDELIKLTHATTAPGADTQGTVVRNVRDTDILQHLAGIAEVLERIHTQFTFVTDVNLNRGEF